MSDLGIAVHDLGTDRAGIVTASHPTIAATDLMHRLRELGINTSTTHVGSTRSDVAARDLPPMVRLSVHCTTTNDEIDRTLDVLGSF
jgi:selenocysteine lyase/cysteine desulfurase